MTLRQAQRDTGMILLVDDDTRLRGIRAVQRDTRVPYCTVSIGIVHGSRGPSTYERIGERAAQVKKEAKRRRGSAVVSESALA